MYDGKQVLRFVTNFKSIDLYNIGNEMANRQGTDIMIKTEPILMYIIKI
ncbi:MAG: hypothetical protein RR161_02895 [Bacilli bacterium]